MCVSVCECWDSISSSVKRGCGCVISGRSEAVNYESSEEPTQHVLVNCVGRDQNVSGVSLFVCLFVFITEVVKLPGLRLSFSSVLQVWSTGLRGRCRCAALQPTDSRLGCFSLQLLQ